MRTRRGWYVSADARRCKGSSGQEKLETRLLSVRRADALGPRVVATLAARVRSVSVKEPWEDSELEELIVQLCGTDDRGMPSCSGFLPFRCHALRRQLLVLERNGWMRSVEAADSTCPEDLLPPGVYFVHFGQADPPNAARKSDVPRSHVGPFASLAAYCNDMPDFSDPFELERGQEMRCARSKRSIVRPLTSRGPLSRVELLELVERTSDSPARECRLAMTTRQGVFVGEADYCRSFVGEHHSMIKKVRSLAWLPRAAGKLFRIENENSSHEEGLRRESRLCGVGASKLPGCTQTVPARCRNDEERIMTIELVPSKGEVELRRRPLKAEHLRPWSVISCSEVPTSVPLEFW